MSEFPKIAQSRLRQQASAPADVHPDTNMLVAFIEGGLKETERENLLAHLSSCAECREVVSLSLPEQDPASIGIARSTSIWDWNSGMMRWGTVAASVVVVAGAVLLLNPNNTISKASKRPAEFKSDSQAQSQAQSKTSEPQSTAPAAAVVAEESNAKRLREKEANDEQDRTRARAEVTSKKQEQSAFMRSPVVPSPPPPLPEKTFNDSLYRANAENKPFVPNSNNNFASIQPRGPSNSAANANAPKDADTGSASKAAASGAVVGGVLAAGNGAGDKAVAEPQNTRTDNYSDLNLKARNAQQVAPIPEQAPKGVQTTRKAAAPAPMKPAPANEAAKNSTDQATAAMQTVEVTGAASEISSSTDAASASAMATSGTNPLWRITPEGKLLTSRGRKDGWHEVDLGERVVRPLYFNTRDIWFAGANGRLYHSSDGGKIWSSIKGAWSAETEIVRLVFRDAQHGELFTLESERWITSDGGKTWQKP